MWGGRRARASGDAVGTQVDLRHSAYRAVGDQNLAGCQSVCSGHFRLGRSVNESESECDRRYGIFGIPVSANLFGPALTDWCPTDHHLNLIAEASFFEGEDHGFLIDHGRCEQRRKADQIGIHFTHCVNKAMG